MKKMFDFIDYTVGVNYSFFYGSGLFIIRKNGKEILSTDNAIDAWNFFELRVDDPRKRIIRKIMDRGKNNEY